MQPTLVGDIERTSIAIAMARESVKQNKWQEAVGSLQSAKIQIESALKRKPRLGDDLEALKAAIDRTITTIERQGKEADSQLAELQIRINAIKTNTF